MSIGNIAAGNTGYYPSTVNLKWPVYATPSPTIPEWPTGTYATDRTTAPIPSFYPPTPSLQDIEQAFEKVLDERVKKLQERMNLYFERLVVDAYLKGNKAQPEPVASLPSQEVKEEALEPGSTGLYKSRGWRVVYVDPSLLEKLLHGEEDVSIHLSQDETGECFLFEDTE